jgi:hypothetical protein
VTAATLSTGTERAAKLGADGVIVVAPLDAGAHCLTFWQPLLVQTYEIVQLSCAAAATGNAKRNNRSEASFHMSVLPYQSNV